MLKCSFTLRFWCVVFFFFSICKEFTRTLDNFYSFLLLQVLGRRWSNGAGREEFRFVQEDRKKLKEPLSLLQPQRLGRIRESLCEAGMRYMHWMLFFFSSHLSRFLKHSSSLEPESWELPVMAITARSFSPQCFWGTCFTTSTERRSPFWCRRLWRRLSWIRRNSVSPDCWSSLLWNFSHFVNRFV